MLLAMPIVHYDGRELFCAPGSNLKEVLVRADLTPHNGPTKYVNCHGMGTCGTCAVEVEGEVSSPGLIERLRLAVPPHRRGSGLRLACKVRVLGDIEVTKHAGMWGQNTSGPKAR
jgi:ferredoxin